MVEKIDLDKELVGGFNALHITGYVTSIRVVAEKLNEIIDVINECQYGMKQRRIGKDYG